jgi:hypothetical protein
VYALRIFREGPEAVSETIGTGIIWAVSVEGDENDLSAASQYFSAVADGRIAKISMNSGAPRWVIISERLQRCAEESEVASEGQAILDVMNGLLFVDDYQSEPIRVAGAVHKRAPNGNWGVAIFVPPMHMRMESRRGLPIKQSDLLSKALNGSNAVRKTLTYIGNQPGWFQIYMAIECLEEMFGGEHKLLKQAWAAKLSIKLLKQSANFHRHANAPDPSGRLNLLQAQRSISEIVRAALEVF